MYEGYRKIKKTKRWVSIGYRKYSEGIENIKRVSEMYEGYRKCTKGIGKLKKLTLGINRVSEIFRGYRKY